MEGLNKVLIVDDSELIHSTYRLFLSRYSGCRIVDAMNSLEALVLLSKENNFDLILLDINMPVMNGVQFMEKIRKEKICRRIPIIVISTEGSQEDTLKAITLGAWGYIVKPFKPPMLHELIEKVIAKKLQFLATARDCRDSAWTFPNS
jgi:two-component system, chemotaxis family, chemotaxis protein CheY